MCDEEREYEAREAIFDLLLIAYPRKNMPEEVKNTKVQEVIEYILDMDKALRDCRGF